jgi:CheY-like chemotaxis protein
VRVNGDANRLVQAVQHLLANGIKYTAAGGRVAVRIREMGAEAVVTVEDSGVGIPADVLPRIFEQFERADRSATRQDGGLGIGLFMVHRIAELHGGSVKAHSAGAGLGSTFTVRLPLAIEAAATAGSHAPAGRSLAGLHLLVVDDDPDTLDLLHDCLRACGAEVRTAGSVAQALSACAGPSRFDAVISDLAMPLEDGFQLLARVRAMPPPLAHVPVIALTAHASEQDGRRALACGFQRYLSKPIDPSVLADAVAAAIAAGVATAIHHG